MVVLVVGGVHVGIDGDGLILQFSPADVDKCYNFAGGFDANLYQSHILLFHQSHSFPPAKRK